MSTTATISRRIDARADRSPAPASDRPTLIVLRTIIGYPAPTRQGTAKAHGEAARQGRGGQDQGDPGLAGRARFLRAARGARRDGGAPRRNGRSAARSGRPGWRATAAAHADLAARIRRRALSGRVARRLGHGAARSSPPAPGSPPARRPARRSRRSTRWSRPWRAARPTSPEAPAPTSKAATDFEARYRPAAISIGASASTPWARR